MKGHRPYNFGQLYEHQKKLFHVGCEILEREGVVVLAAETRVGKSRVALALAAGRGPVLVLTKKAACRGWLGEVAEMGLGDSVDVINYQSAHRATSRFGREPAAVVLDESHAFLSAFPKLTKTALAVRALIRSGVPAILCSGTPAVESSAQWFHQFAVTGRGPWASFKSFYAWHREYGEPYEVRVSGGRMVKMYDKVDEKRVQADLAPFLAVMTKKQADRTFVEAETVVHRIKPPDAFTAWVKGFEKDSVAHLDRVLREPLVAETKVGLLQKLHQLAGGSVKVDDRRRVALCAYKADYLREAFSDRQKVAVLYQYVADGELLDRILGSLATRDLDEHRNGGAVFFIGQIKSYCEGVDFSYCDCSVLFSWSWSGTTFIQARDRLCNKRRTDVAMCHVLIGEGTIDEMVYNAVSEKQDFNTRFYERSTKAARK